MSLTRTSKASKSRQKKCIVIISFIPEFLLKIKTTEVKDEEENVSSL